MILHTCYASNFTDFRSVRTCKNYFVIFWIFNYFILLLLCITGAPLYAGTASSWWWLLLWLWGQVATLDPYTSAFFLQAQPCLFRTAPVLHHPQPWLCNACINWHKPTSHQEASILLNSAVTAEYESQHLMSVQQIYKQNDCRVLYNCVRAKIMGDKVKFCP